jgi:outer membrane protein OmpA-like peptidoglycan-associated protein
MKLMPLLTIIFIISIANNREACGETRNYMASFDKSKWNVATSKLKCQLTHEIPEYGTIEFVQEAGFPESSFLHLLYGRTVMHTRAEIKFLPPLWKPELPTLPGWKFALARSGFPIILSTRQARRILDAIEQGFVPTIFHIDNNNRRDDIKASISSVRFNNAYNKYMECQANIIPVSFAEIRNSAVYFDNASARLDDESILWLNYVLEYVKNPDVNRIELEGYTDSIGSFRENHQLASLRVERVRDYLIQHGIDEKLLRLKVYGEQRAIASNSTPDGRAKNRRVNVKIFR